MRVFFVLIPMLLIGCSPVDSVQVFDEKQAAVVVKHGFLPAKITKAK